MRIDSHGLPATNTFGRLGGEINGVAHTCQRLAACFREEGVPLDVVACGDEDASEKDGHVTVRAQRPGMGIHIDRALQIDPLFSTGAVARAILKAFYRQADLVRNGVDGVVAANDDELRGAVTRLACHPEIRLALGAAAREEEARRGWPAIFRGLLSIYDEAAALRETKRNRAGLARRAERASVATLRAGKLQSGSSR